LVKTDGIGNKIWDRTYGGDETEDLSQVIVTQDGGFLVTGESYSDDNGDKSEPNLGSEQTWILKADSAGNKVWDKTIFTNGHDESGFVAEDGLGCYVVVNFCSADTGGYKTEDSKGYGDYFVVKICPDSLVSLNENDRELFCKIRPNPATEYIELITFDQHEVMQAEITDITGKQLLISELPGMEPVYKIPLDGLANGWYSLRIKTAAGIQVLPFVKSEPF
jgi:hypothetical protein